MQIALIEKLKLGSRKKNLENGLIDELLRLSSTPRTNDLQLILGKLSESRNKIISDEFRNLKAKIERGHKPRELFEILKKKYNSEILNRFLELIYLSTTTGTVNVSDYKQVADNFLKSKQLIDERSSLLLMQKYTIIFAGGLIVPGILGIIIALVRKLGSTMDLGLLGLQTSIGLYQVSYYCAIVYILEYVVISSIYLSLLESESKKSLIYLVCLLPVSILIFFCSMMLV
jgi:hypothetical protein